MGEAFDSGGDIGGDNVSSDISSDVGSDIDSGANADFDGDLNSNTEAEAGIDDGIGDDLNSDSDVCNGMDESVLDSVNATGDVRDVLAGKPVDGMDEEADFGEDLNVNTDELGDLPPDPELSEHQDGETNEIVDQNDIPDDYGSSFNDRERQTPINNGEWSGDRGNSTWKPETEDVAEQLRQHGVDGIDYRDGFPDFSPVSAYEHQLPEELHESKDPAQFNDCNNALSNHLENNPEFARNFDDDQLEAIRSGEKPSGFTWHHDVEPGNMQLVPSRIHQNCGHYGGKNVWGGGTTNRKLLEE